MAPKLDRAVIVGFGSHGRAVGRALLQRGCVVVAADDSPRDEAVSTALELGIDLHAAPTDRALAALFEDADCFIPTPGLPESHAAFAAARTAGVPAVTEFDLASAWDDRPIYAVTGTDGKTTVTTMIETILNEAGIRTVVAGNTEPPLVVAIDDPTYECFVVEASSFRLAASTAFAPQVAVWLNFGPDHLDVHTSLDEYEAAKANIWRNHGPGSLAIACADDPVVLSHAPTDGTVETFGLTAGDHRVINGELTLHGVPFMPVADLARQLPHDQTNALAAAAVAAAAGVSPAQIASGLASFVGLPHRVEFIAEREGVRWFNDSKATTPHAVLAGVTGFDSVVLIAGGRNKGLDLTPLRSLSTRLRAVVVTGDAAAELTDTFVDTPVVQAESMREAVERAEAQAQPGDVVILSPGCTSYDWYRSYAERGRDFADAVRALLSAEVQT